MCVCLQRFAAYWFNKLVHNIYVSSDQNLGYLLYHCIYIYVCVCVFFCATYLCLRTGNRTCFLQLFELAHMFDATQHLGLGWGWGVITFLNLNTCRCYATSGLAHMFDATQHLGLHTWLLLRNTMGWGGGGWG